MFKKALQVAATFGLLLAGYLGYVQGFALVAAWVSRDPGVESVPFAVNSSKSKKETTALAVRAFGRDHWTTDEEHTIRYYNSDRGYWMYARSYERLKDGKQLKFEPFALISWSRDRRSLKTITSDKAVIDLDQPLGLANKSDTPIHVIHAMIEGNVRLRDDKATRIPDDDLVIGPMAYIEYDEADLEIRSDREVVIQDLDMRVTGTGFLIKIRPKNETDPGTGFPGAKTAYLRRDVHIVMNDVGRSGILPGTARPEQAQGDKTPLDLRCAGQMQVDLPRERRYPPTFVGPPQPSGTTLATFTRDVVVLRGKLHQMPDQLNCDDLRLILIRSEKAPAARAGPRAEPGKDDLLAAAPDLSQEEDSGGGSALTLRRAEATGHAVWLQSKSDGLTVRCNELIHKKLTPEQADETYFRGDATTRLQVEKLELVKDGPDKGKVQSVLTIRTTDAAIFDDGQNKDDATVVARGPGVLEIRPARDRPVERKATWDDQLILQTEEVVGRAVQKKITLTRNPKLVDLTRGTLDARAKIVIWLKPKPRPAVAAATPGIGNTATASSSAAESYEIDMLRAWERVHLAAPNRTMDARDLLEVKFESPTPVAAANPGPAPKMEGSPAPAAPDAAGAEASASASTPTPATASDPLAATQQEVAEKPATDPEVFVKANRVWAKIRLHPDRGAAASPSPGSPDAIAGSKSEIEMVMLRGAVDFHQDPEPGKQRGIDVIGDALDVIGQGQGRSKFTVYQRDPYAPRPAPGPSRPLPPARVATEEFTATGEKIGLDQVINQAWVDGPGTLTQMAKRGLLTDQGLDEPAGRDRVDPKAPPEPTTPMTISWQRAMRFYGSPPEGKDPAVARAEFYASVRAEMEDSLLVCQEMKTYMDRTVTLVRSKPDPKASPSEPEPKPQIAWVDCVRQVTAITRKVDPASRALMQQQRIEGEHVTYDKVTGNFQVEGAGRVLLYNREGEAANGPDLAPGLPSAARRVSPTANPEPPAANARRATDVAEADGGPRAKAKAKPLPPLKLTQVTFSRKMKGRFVSGKDRAETRWADFFGDVQALNAKVPDEKATFDFDRPPDDGLYLTAQTLRVISEPPPPGSNSPSQNFLKAWENAQARTKIETIQGDVITYDSLKELFYAYGTDGREVIVAQQSSPGQPPTIGPGQAVQYNRKTGEWQIISPGNMEIVDAKTGGRPGPPEEPKVKPPKSTRTPLRLPGRSSIERKSMIGR